MDKLKRIGIKRYDEEKKSSKSPYIHSYKTFDAYKQTMIEFTTYLKVTRPEVKRIEHITKEIAIEYIKHREQEGFSAYTYYKDMSAINKVLGLGINRENCKVKGRSIAQITRSREVVNQDSTYNPDNYRAQILIARATGIRRQSMLVIKPEDFRLEGKNLLLHVKEKGGRERDIHVLNDYKEQVLEIVNKSKKGKPIFDVYPKAIDNHAFRSEYATNRYNDLKKELESYGNDKRQILMEYGFAVTKKEKLSSRQFSYKNIEKLQNGYHKELLAILSQNLGHNRLRVCVDHYLRR